MKRPIECRANASVISWGSGDNGELEFIIYAYATDDNPNGVAGRDVHVKLTASDAASIFGLLKRGAGDEE